MSPPTIDHAIPNCMKLDPLVDLEAKFMQLANWGSILSTRELSCGIKLRSIYNKISVELYNPQFMAHQFGVTSHPSLSAE